MTLVWFQMYVFMYIFLKGWKITSSKCLLKCKNIVIWNLGSCLPQILSMKGAAYFPYLTPQESNDKEKTLEAILFYPTSFQSIFEMQLSSYW